MSTSLLIAGILTLDIELTTASSKDMALDKLLVPLAKLLDRTMETDRPMKSLILQQTALLDSHLESSTAEEANDTF